MVKIVGGSQALEFNLAGLGLNQGDLVYAGADRISVSYGGGYFGHYWGSFQYDGAGQLVGGAVNVYEEVDNGVRVMAVTDANLPAVPIAAMILADDSFGLLSTVLGGADNITGSTQRDFIIALDGDDTVDGGLGDDDINGNVGADRMLGGGGADWVRGGKGDDLVSGDAGDDPHVNGNMGDDLVYGMGGNDTVYGGQGNDAVGGGDGDDFVSGDLGNDALIGEKGADFLVGGAGGDGFFFNPGDGIDGIGDFNSAQGDRIYLRAGTSYTVTTLGAFAGPNAVPADWEGFAVVDIHNDTDAIIIYGVTPSALANWLVYF